MFIQKSGGRFSVSLIWMHYNLIFILKIFRACFPPREKDINCLCALFHERIIYDVFNMTALPSRVFNMSGKSKLEKLCLI